MWAALQRHQEEEDFLRELSYAHEDQGAAGEAAELKAEAEKTAGIARKIRALLEEVPGD